MHKIALEVLEIDLDGQSRYEGNCDGNKKLFDRVNLEKK